MDASQIPTRASVVTPSDTAPCFGVGIIYSGGACTVVTASGDTVVLASAFAGLVIPLQIAQVMDTGTDATDILVLK